MQSRAARLRVPLPRFCYLSNPFGWPLSVVILRSEPNFPLQLSDAAIVYFLLLFLTVFGTAVLEIRWSREFLHPTLPPTVHIKQSKLSCT